MPELDLSFDLSAFDTPLGTSGGSSLMSPPSLISSRSSQQAAEREVEDLTLDLPSGNTSIGGGLGGFDIGLVPGIGSVGKSESGGPGPSVLGDETGILDVGWEFDEQGNVIETTQAPERAGAVPSAGPARAPLVGTNSEIAARVRQEHDEGFNAAQQVNMLLAEGNLHLMTLDRDWNMKIASLPLSRMSTAFLRQDLSLLFHL